MDYRPALSVEQKAWLHAEGYEVVSFIARGRSAGVWLVERKGKRFAAKVEHPKSTRMRMLEKEVRFLQSANTQKIGPRFYHVDLPNNMLVMQYVEGIPFGKWLIQNKSKVKLEKVVKEVFRQARALDGAGLDHGQLGGKLHNILIDKKGRVCVIDFEKASEVRKPRNVRVLTHELLSGKTPVSGKILALLGPSSNVKSLS